MKIKGYDQDGNYVHTLEGDDHLVELSKIDGVIYIEDGEEE